jgi:aspartate 1-decarboxylase
MKLNGAAARLVHQGDTIIVISYAGYDADELASYEPRVVHVSAHNKILNVNSEVATLFAAPTVA